MIRAPLEQLGARARRTRARLGPRRRLVEELGRELASLGPWYQPVDLGHGLVAPARDKAGVRHSPTRSLDRGLGKWRAFVEPSLPFPLAGKRVLEVGCNAGLHLVECLRQGAREAVGLELDERYYRQARFVARALERLEDRYAPLRVYRGAMERFEWELLGRFDLALLLNVIYHVGRVERTRLPDDETFALQVETVRGVAAWSRLLVFAANPLQDDGYGKGADSIRRIVDAAGLEVVREVRHPHPRGYVLVAGKADFDDGAERAPLSRLVSKYFLPPRRSAEHEAARRLLVDGAGALEGSRYFRLRTGRDTWLSPSQASLPAGLEREPCYWVVPWSCKPRQRAGRPTRDEAFPALAAGFETLVRSLEARGFDPSLGRVRAYKLVHPEHGAVYQYVDGNQRLGALAAIAERTGSDPEVPVSVELEVRRERLLDYPLTRQLVEEGAFTEADVYRWFDNAFWIVGERA